MLSCLLLARRPPCLLPLCFRRLTLFGGEEDWYFVSSGSLARVRLGEGSFSQRKSVESSSATSALSNPGMYAGSAVGVALTLADVPLDSIFDDVIEVTTFGACSRTLHHYQCQVQVTVFRRCMVRALERGRLQLYQKDWKGWNRTASTKKHLPELLPPARHRHHGHRKSALRLFLSASKICVGLTNPRPLNHLATLPFCIWITNIA